MGRRIEPRERITQKSVSIKARQREFIDFMETEDPRFNVHVILQKALDHQMAEMPKAIKFLATDDPRRINENN